MKRRSASERAAVVTKYRESGQTRRAFAAAEGISKETLRNWLAEAEGTPFIELPRGTRTEVELRFADGTVLTVRG